MRRVGTFLSALAACGVGIAGTFQLSAASAGVVHTPMTAALQAKLSEVPPAAASSPPDEAPAAEAQIQTIHRAIASAMADSNTYAGIVDHPETGTVTLYVTAAGKSQAAAEVDAANDSSSVDVVTVQRSNQQLNALANLITADRAQIVADGIDMQSWATDISSNTVNVVVSSSVAAATSYFNSLYGSGVVTVTSSNGGAIQDTSTRFADSTPYWDGDEIITGGGACTSNFYYTGNSSGHVFGLTAGHCGSGSVTTPQGASIGSTSTNYFRNGGEDAQSYTCTNNFSTCGGGFVWYGPNSNQYYPVTQLCGGNCQVGDLVTADGDQNGGNQVTNNKITSTNYNYNDQGINETGLDEANNQNGVQPAVAGDSGGPVYQRQSDGSVWANGLIIGEITPPTYGVIYDPMSQVMSVVNGTLIFQ